MITLGARWHFGISLIKSALRLVGGALYFLRNDLAAFVAAFTLAEVLGIAEEIFDKR